MNVTFNGKEYDLAKIEDCEFYSVEEDEENEGKKVVKIDGYLWKYYDDGTWRHSYYCWAYIPITGEPIEDEEVTDIECECTMYEEEDIAETSIPHLAENYFAEYCDGQSTPIIPLLIEDVTEDTPCGLYINMEP